MGRNGELIHEIAEKLIRNLQPNKKIYPGDMAYVSTCSRLIASELDKYYKVSKVSGVIPPSPETVRGWFYNGCPDWAAVALTYAIAGQEYVTR